MKKRLAVYKEAFLMDNGGARSLAEEVPMTP